eukprot:TRINITY_DN28018_c0_g1_i1.p1 TRINITY_DN28018_c0_g1~~TRINITY_DN28018_c0_g1_i1.p1  ORF type:complete len:152 (+),score=7.71 TRINITY_DN28018_c0_g1_i1:53-508(+)
MTDTPSVAEAVYDSLKPQIILLLTYFTWYVWIASHFPLDPSARTKQWGTAILISVLVGLALNANSYSPPLKQYITLHRWAIMRFFLIPLCVSSYSSIAVQYKFIALFPVEDWTTGLIGVGATGGMMLLLIGARFYLAIQVERVRGSRTNPC